MNHSFVLGVGMNRCNKCGRAEVDHTDQASCEACDYVGKCEVYLTTNDKLLLLCPSCIEKEEAVEEALPAPIVYDDPITLENARLRQAKEIDNSIHVRSDLFNAETVSIIELKDIVDADETITNKHFKLAQLLTDRLNGFKKAIHDMNEEMVGIANRQNRVQIYLNELSNKLRVEEREQIKLADINYKPNPVKVSKPRESKVRKFDKAEVRKWALAAKMPESVIQMLCLAKNLTPEQAAQSFISAGSKQ